jgi:hypothetical protein
LQIYKLLKVLQDWGRENTVKQDKKLKKWKEYRHFLGGGL